MRGTPRIVGGGTSGGGGGGDPTIGNPVIGADPNLFLYTDASGNLYQDALASRDSVTNETYIGYLTGAGQFTNAFHLGNILGGALSDGAAFQRHDSINDNFTFIGTVDMTPFGGTSNAVLKAYVDSTNNIYSTCTTDSIGNDLTYNNGLLNVYGTVGTNDTNTYLEHSDNSTTYQAQVYLQSDKIQTRFEDITTGRIMKDIVDGTSVRAGDFGSTGNKMSYTLDDANRYFQVFGLYNSLTNSYGNMLNLDAQNETMSMGDITNISSHVKVVTDTGNGVAYIDGLASPVPNWTPSTLSDGFTGTGLNDMHYDSTVTYNGAYPNTYNATIATVDSVYMQLVSISTPGFNIGNTVTDGSGSTGTIIKGGDIDGYIIIQPIVDTGWTSATAISDISTGAASTVSGVIYTDTMSWTASAGGSETYVPCNTFIALNNGLTVGYTNQTGHTLGDNWTWEMIANYTYSKMALFDGFNAIQSVGDVDQELDSIRTEWVHDTSKGGSITEYLGEQGSFNVSSNTGNILSIIAVGASSSGDVIIYNPYSGSGYDLFRAEFDSAGLGIGIKVSDTGSQRSVLIGDDVGLNNGTNILVDDINSIVSLRNKVALNTPAVQATTATVGNVFTLTDAATGEGEWSAGVTKTHEYFDSYTGSTITLSNTPSFIYIVSKNGQVLSEGVSRDYTVSGTTLTFAVALSSDNIQVVYEY